MSTDPEEGQEGGEGNGVGGGEEQVSPEGGGEQAEPEGGGDAAE